MYGKEEITCQAKTLAVKTLQVTTLAKILHRILAKILLATIQLEILHRIQTTIINWKYLIHKKELSL